MAEKLSLIKLYDLIENGIKIVIIATSLNIHSNASKLYYILKNSRYADRVFCNDTIAYHKESRTRIKEHFVAKGLVTLKEQCIISHYKSITQLMLKEHLLILADSYNKSVTNDLFKKYNIKYIFDDKIDIRPQLRLECRDDNYFRISNNPVRPIVTSNKYLIFDTETNGVPLNEKYRSVSYLNEYGWSKCRMLSIAWLVVDENFKILTSYHTLIKNPNIRNTVSAQAINKIEDEYRNSTGISFEEMMQRFYKDVLDCPYIVSHGSDFDFNLLMSECIKYEVNTDPLKNKIILNTKQNLWKENYKQRLSDLITLDEKMYPEIMTLEPHNALYDCYLCLELLKIRLNVNVHNTPVVGASQIQKKYSNSFAHDDSKSHSYSSYRGKIVSK